MLEIRNNYSDADIEDMKNNYFYCSLDCLYPHRDDMSWLAEYMKQQQD